MKRRSWVAGALCLTAAGVVAAKYGGGAGEAGPQYVTAAIERGPLAARVTATGVLSALVTVQVGSQISGRIQELGADFNAKVTKGQMLARIEPQLLQAALAQARANHAAVLGNLAKARANARNAARRLVRFKMLAAGKLIPDAELEQVQAESEAATAEVSAALGNVAQARAAMRQGEVNLTYTTVVSPVDGVVISRNVDVGQTVAASLQAPTLFTIAGDLTKMQVDTSVAESDVGKLQANSNAVFTVDAYPDAPFHGTVREVRNAPQTLQGVVTYDAVIDVDNADRRLKPGMTAHVSLRYASREEVLKVPNAALRFHPFVDGARRVRRRDKMRAGGEPVSEQRRVWVLQRGSATAVPVHVGISDGSMTEVDGEGVHAGDEVILQVAEPGKAAVGPIGGPAARLF